MRNPFQPHSIGLPTDRRIVSEKGGRDRGCSHRQFGFVWQGSPCFRQEDERSGKLRKGDAAILRFLAAAEILETDLWQQYNELGGIQDSEVPGGSGSPLYTAALAQLDSDMAQYIHDNTEDELTHEVFINAYLASKGADTVDLDKFRTLPSSKASGAQQIGRLTNLMQLSVDTTWWTRYIAAAQRIQISATPSRKQSPPSLWAIIPPIPKTDADLSPSDHLQAIANTAGFHFGTSSKAAPASIPPWRRGSQTLKFANRAQHRAHGSHALPDLAGQGRNAPASDRSHRSYVGFFQILIPLLVERDFQTNLIMPEPTVFLSHDLPACSIVRPTNTKGVAMGALQFLTASQPFPWPIEGVLRLPS